MKDCLKAYASQECEPCYNMIKMAILYNDFNLYQKPVGLQALQSNTFMQHAIIERGDTEPMDILLGLQIMVVILKRYRNIII